MAYVIPPTSHELLQEILNEIKGLREDIKPRVIQLNELTVPSDKNQRIYLGGSQYHEHHPTVGEARHADAKLHDGYWRHYHDDGGMVATG